MRIEKETCYLHFCLVPEGLLRSHLLALSSQYPHVQVKLYPSCGTVSLSLSAPSSQDLLPFTQSLEQHFGSYLYSAPSGKIAEALRFACVQRKKTLACAESCTGGRIAVEIVSIPGASDFFLG